MRRARETRKTPNHRGSRQGYGLGRLRFALAASAAILGAAAVPPAVFAADRKAVIGADDGRERLAGDQQFFGATLAFHFIEAARERHQRLIDAEAELLAKAHIA